MIYRKWSNNTKESFETPVFISRVHPEPACSGLWLFTAVSGLENNDGKLPGTLYMTISYDTI